MKEFSMSFRSVLIGLAVLWSITAHAQSTSSSTLVDRMIENLASTQTLSADFSQTTAGASGKPRISSGTLAISKPGLLRWEVKKPYPQLQILDGKNFWLYDPDLMQATMRPVASANLTGVAGLLLNSSVLEKETLLDRYTFSAQGVRDGLSWVQVIPKVEEPGVAKLIVGLDSDAMMQRFEIHDALGQMTRIQLSKLTKNTALDPALFRFTPPKGVNVMQAP
jgi:outer membrane lipoprotein carrier protein